MATAVPEAALAASLTSVAGGQIRTSPGGASSVNARPSARISLNAPLRPFIFQLPARSVRIVVFRGTMAAVPVKLAVSWASPYHPRPLEAIWLSHAAAAPQSLEISGCNRHHRRLGAGIR